MSQPNSSISHYTFAMFDLFILVDHLREGDRYLLFQKGEERIIYQSHLGFPDSKYQEISQSFFR
jgi:hypothetical protein